MNTERYFEDFSSGEIIPLGPHTVEAGEIVELASEFDP